MLLDPSNRLVPISDQAGFRTTEQIQGDGSKKLRPRKARERSSSLVSPSPLDPLKVRSSPSSHEQKGPESAPQSAKGFAAEMPALFQKAAETLLDLPPLSAPPTKAQLRAWSKGWRAAELIMNLACSENPTDQAFAEQFLPAIVRKFPSRAGRMAVKLLRYMESHPLRDHPPDKLQDPAVFRKRPQPSPVLLYAAIDYHRRWEVRHSRPRLDRPGKPVQRGQRADRRARELARIAATAREQLRKVPMSHPSLQASPQPIGTVRHLGVVKLSDRDQIQQKIKEYGESSSQLSILELAREDRTNLVLVMCYKDAAILEIDPCQKRGDDDDFATLRNSLNDNDLGFDKFYDVRRLVRRKPVDEHKLSQPDCGPILAEDLMTSLAKSTVPTSRDGVLFRRMGKELNLFRARPPEDLAEQAFALRMQRLRERIRTG